MYEVEITEYGVKNTFSGSIDRAEMQAWVEEAEEIIDASDHAGSEWGCLIDMRELQPLEDDVRPVMIKGQRMYREKGMNRSCVILNSAKTARQFRKIAKESGIFEFERYIDASSTPNWEERAMDWIEHEVAPTNAIIDHNIPRSAGERESRAQKVLLLESDKEDAELIRKYCEAIDCWDITLEHISSVEAALDFLKQQDVDILLVSYYLESTIALEVLEDLQLREIQVPTIILTEGGDQDLAAEVLRAGADDCRSKLALDSNVLIQALLYVTRKFEHKQTLVEQATKDSLTDLFQRSHFMKKLRQELNRCCRYSKSLCFVMIDLDEFKQVNDVHGHIVGDHVLRRIGLLIKNTIRDSDFAGRYGGDEIAVVLPDTDDDRGHVLAERLNEKINNKFFKIPNGDSIKLSASFGLAEFDGTKHQKANEKIIRSVIDQADQALYLAKQKGPGIVERRREPRHHLESIEVTLEYEDREVKGQLVDYSTHGARLKVPEEPDSETISWGITPEGGEPLEREAEVRWAARVGSEGLYEIGLQLEFPEDIALT